MNWYKQAQYNSKFNEYDDTFEISSPEGASSIGFFRNQDFPNQKGTKLDRGEIFLTSVPEGQRYKGIGYDITQNAIKKLKEMGTNFVKMSPTSEGGRKIIKKLIDNKIISEALQEAHSGVKEYKILI